MLEWPSNIINTVHDVRPSSNRKNHHSVLVVKGPWVERTLCTFSFSLSPSPLPSALFAHFHFIYYSQSPFCIETYNTQNTRIGLASVTN